LLFQGIATIVNCIHPATRTLSALTHPPVFVALDAMPKRVFITVGEASGDLYAAYLIRELLAMDPTLIIEGMGGEAMRAAGATVHADTVEHATMGLRVIFRYTEITRMLKWTAEYFKKNQPDLQICIDSWAMNWHWARQTHTLGVPVLYYIPPQLWASRPGRIKRLSKYVDRVACILPWEEKFYADRGVRATFVGLPLFDLLPPQKEIVDSARFPHVPPVIGILPGSRRSVVNNNLIHQLDVADEVIKKYPGAIFLIPTMPATHLVVWRILRDRYLPKDSPQPGPDEVHSIGPFTFGLRKIDEMVPKCDLCLTVSGTATLHVACYNVPLIVVYRISPIMWYALGWLVKTRTYSLVNLLSDDKHPIVPEFIPWFGSNAPVIAKTLEYLENPALLAEQRRRLDGLIHTLRKPGASRNAARVAIELMEARGKTLPPGTKL
jgi:lipid-A-disaccharide synthase